MKMAVLILITSLSVSAESVFDQGVNVYNSLRTESNSLKGIVKSVADTNEQTLVKLAIEGQDEQIFKVCLAFKGGDVHDKVERQLIFELREAMTSGRVIKVELESAFHRCISKIADTNKTI